MFRSVAPREFLVVAAIAFVAVLVGLVLPPRLSTLQAAESWLRDFRFGALPRHEPQNPDIVIVAVTEDTLATLPYRSPVDRGFIARLVRNLDAAGPRAIGIDILFDQPTEPAKDAALQETLRGLSAPVVAVSAAESGGLTKAQKAFLATFTEGIPTAPANLVKDAADGTVRWVFGGHRVDGGWRPGFVGALAQAIGVQPPKADLPLAYRHGPDAKTPAFKTFPAHVAAVLPKAWFKDKVVLVGADLPLIDRHRTPFAAAFGVKGGERPGVVIHAHALAQLIDGRRPPSLGPTGNAALMTAVAALGMAFALLDVPLVAAVAGFAVVLVGLWVGGFLLYDAFGLMAPLLAPTLAFTLSTGGGVAYVGKRDRDQKRFIRNAFSRYISPAIVNDLVRHPERLNLGGERRELSYLFTDLADFTAFTERTEPAVMVPLLNEYLDAMCAILFKHGATIDKIVGDAVVGFFNAPLEQPDHHARAVATALDIDAFGQAFVKTQAERGLTLGVTRIGVHSGTAVIGNFGGETFFDYTAHGDMVNTAARLEAVNKHLGTRVCVSGVTAAHCPDHAFRPVGALVLKGKTAGLEAFEPLAPGTREPAAVMAYGKAFALMRADNPDAAEAFRQVIKIDPDDGLARFHLSRLEKGETGATIVMSEK